MNHKQLLKPLAIAVVVGFAGTAIAGPSANTANAEDQLEQRVDTLSRQLETLKVQLQELKAQNEALATQQEQQARHPTPTAAQGRLSSFDNLSLWGYGEIYYARPTRQPDKAQADLARAVFGIGYRFDDKTHFNSEYEVEHAVSSADDPGEFEVEQFYVDHMFNKSLSGEAGLFLLPAGLLNEHHEPTAFYGVQRNFVETLVIPSTWREGGLALRGETDAGLGWNIGVTTGVDLSKWEFNPENPLYSTALDLENSGVAPLQATHQELALANAQHLSQYLSLTYRGVPGLETGAFLYTGLAAVPTGHPDQRITLWEAHARWTPGRADLSALYARGTISNTAGDNLANVGASNPMPASFYGYYLQGAYTVWQRGDSRLAPFVRWERYQLGASYEGIPAGFSPLPTGTTSSGGSWPLPYDRVWTMGANYYLTPHVVVKADYQKFQDNADLTRIDLGLGLDF